MTKVRDGLPRRAKATGLDRLKAELERIVQPRQLGRGHLVISIRENQIESPIEQHHLGDLAQVTCVTAEALVQAVRDLRAPPR